LDNLHLVLSLLVRLLLLRDYLDNLHPEVNSASLLPLLEDHCNSKLLQDKVPHLEILI
jgi:hypothetical protein